MRFIPIKPWDRQENEPIKSFEAFNMFRRMPPSIRSLRELQKKYKVKTTPTLNRWSSEYNWYERAEAWDMHVIEEQRKLEMEQALEKIKLMNDRQANESEAFQRSLVLPVAVLGKMLEDNKKREQIYQELMDLPVIELYDLITKGARVYNIPSNLERIARGAPTDITKSDSTVNLKQVTNIGEMVANDADATDKLTAFLESMVAAQDSKSSNDGDVFDQREIPSNETYNLP